MNDASFRRAQRRLTDRVLDAAHLASGHDVIEVGCGFGGNLAVLDERVEGSSLTGVDVGPPQLALARERVRGRGANRLAWIEGDATALPLPDAAFDRLLAVECAFHFPSRRACLREAARVLRPCARVVLTDLVATPAGQAAADGRLPEGLARALAEDPRPLPGPVGRRGIVGQSRRRGGVPRRSRRGSDGGGAAVVRVHLRGQDAGLRRGAPRLRPGRGGAGVAARAGAVSPPAPGAGAGGLKPLPRMRCRGAHRPRRGAHFPRRPPPSGVARCREASRSAPPSTPAAIGRRPLPRGVEERTLLVAERSRATPRCHRASPAAAGRRGAHRPRRGAHLPRRPTPSGVEEHTSLDAPRHRTTPVTGERRGAHLPRRPTPSDDARYRRASRSTPSSSRSTPPSTPHAIGRRPRPASVEERTSLDAPHHPALPAAAGRRGTHLPRRPPPSGVARCRGASRSAPPSTPAAIRRRPPSSLDRRRRGPCAQRPSPTLGASRARRASASVGSISSALCQCARACSASPRCW